MDNFLYIHTRMSIMENISTFMDVASNALDTD